MKYLAVVIIILGILIPSTVYAWPEPKDYSNVVGWNGQWHTQLDGGRWASQAKYCFRLGEDVPPQLDPIQANRWRVSYPVNRARLAERYGVPQEIAEKYGAVYKDYTLGVY